jgi:nucleobase:cation symporter-1, NCS1 family
MSVCIPTYMLASGLIAGGMNWWQAIGTILLGNLIVLVPMLLNAHAGTKYGIPFPVLVRASFGVRARTCPASCARWWPAAGSAFRPGSAARPSIPCCASCGRPGRASRRKMGLLLRFWLLNMAVIWRGIETIKFLEGIGAPFMLAVGLLLLWWITRKAGGLGPVLSAPSKFHTWRRVHRFFVPSLTGMVGFWATVALNIPDFTRYAKSQKAQMVGQALGLPTAMTLYSFIGVAVTSASVVIFGEAIWDPVALLGRFHQPAVAFVALIALLIATLNTNVAANVVSPSNDFSNLNPRLISFRTGGLITGVVGASDDAVEAAGRFQRYIFGWLVGYSGCWDRLPAS